jgi:hypothetical protein
MLTALLPTHQFHAAEDQKMKLKNILLISLLLKLSMAQANTNWVLVSGTGSANEYIDMSTIQRSGNVVTAWILGDLADARPFKGRTFRSLKTQVEFDCAANRFRLIHASLYSGQMGAGTVLESGPASNPWEPAVPQSVGQTKLRTVCQR